MNYLREMNNHIANKWHSQVSNPGPLAPELRLLTTVMATEG